MSTQKLSPQQLTKATIALCLGSLLVFANLYLTHPLLALFAEEFQLTEVLASKSLTVATFTLAISFLVFGPLSDVVGRRTIMLISFLGITLTTLALSFVQTFEQLLWLRALHGFLLGGLPATAIAYIGEEFPKQRVAATIGLYISFNSLGGISGRIFSGLISDVWQWQSVFMIATVCNVFAIILLSYVLPKSTAFVPQDFNLKRVLQHLLNHLKNRPLLAAYLVGGLNFMIFLTLYSYAIFVLADEPYLLSPTWLGLLFLTYLSGTLSSAITGIIDRWLNCSQRIMLGTALIIVGSAITLSGQLYSYIAGLVINGFGFFLAHASLTAWVNRNSLTAKASASSLYLVFYYFGASVGSVYLNPFWQWAQWSGVVSGAILTTCFTLGMCFYLYRKEQQHP